MKHFRIAVLAFLALSCAQAQSGHWEGTLQAPNGDHQIVIDLAKSEKQARGRAPSTRQAQGMKDIPLEQIGVDGAKVKFTVNTTRAALTFAGFHLGGWQNAVGDAQRAMGNDMPPCKLTQK